MQQPDRNEQRLQDEEVLSEAAKEYCWETQESKLLALYSDLIP